MELHSQQWRSLRLEENSGPVPAKAAQLAQARRSPRMSKGNKELVRLHFQKTWSAAFNASALKTQTPVNDRGAKRPRHTLAETKQPLNSKEGSWVPSVTDARLSTSPSFNPSRTELADRRGQYDTQPSPDGVGLRIAPLLPKAPSVQASMFQDRLLCKACQLPFYNEATLDLHNLPKNLPL